MKEKLLTALRRIGVGALYGIGFGLIVTAIFPIIIQEMESSVYNDKISSTVVITKHEETKLADQNFILGTVENRGTRPVRNVRITVDLFDKQGKLVDQYHEYVHGTLNPGESRNFKLSCTGFKQKEPVEHASYKLEVTGF
jgi:hypothetical protein